MRHAIVSGAATLACVVVAAQEPSRAAAGSSLAERFKQLDRNGDGRLTRTEVQQSPLFEQWDANKDGVVTLEEAQAYYSRRSRPHPAPERPGSSRPEGGPTHAVAANAAIGQNARTTPTMAPPRGPFVLLERSGPSPRQRSSPPAAGGQHAGHAQHGVLDADLRRDGDGSAVLLLFVAVQGPASIDESRYTGSARALSLPEDLSQTVQMALKTCA
jgi:hypothetical protein